MEQIGNKERTVRFIQCLQETNIIIKVEEFENDEWKEKELVLDSNRRPIPVPYTEEP